MDLSDAERYALAALFTLATHSTHVEAGLDKKGGDASIESLVWGCPSEDVFEELLLGDSPLKLTEEQLSGFWGYECIAQAGLCCRVYAYLRIPQKAWPGLLRMPEVPGSAGATAGVEDFVTLVRRYSAFLDPALVFTTGAAGRLQHNTQSTFSTDANASSTHGAASAAESEATTAGAPAGTAGAAASAAAALQVRASCDSAASSTGSLANTPKHAGAGAAGSGGLFETQLQQHLLEKAISELEVQARGGSSGGQLLASAEPQEMQQEQVGKQGGEPVGAPVAAAVATTGEGVQQARWAEAEDGRGSQNPLDGRQEGRPEQAAATAAADSSSGGHSSGTGIAAAPKNGREGGVQGGNLASVASLPAGQSFEELYEAVESLARVATEGTVVPEATFSPADSYSHETSHKAVLALYELIGGCLSTNTDSLVEEIGLLRGGLGAVEGEGHMGAMWYKFTNRESSSSGSGVGSSSGGAGLLGGLLRDKGELGDARGSNYGGSGSRSSSRRNRGQSSLGRKSNSGGKGGSAGGGYSQRPGAAWFPEDGGGGTYNTAVDDDTSDDGGSADNSGDSSSSCSTPKLLSSAAERASGEHAAQLQSSARHKSPLSKCSREGQEASGSDLSTLQHGESLGHDSELPGGYAALGTWGAEQGDRAASGARGEVEEYETLGASAVVRVRWYDARCRVAVKRVAHWLRVPWPKVCAFEQMWVCQALELNPAVQPSYRRNSQTMTYLKVGAAALGGGALLAITGGLAAPAIAAGLGAAVTLMHGGAAAAAAVTGFAGSAAGTATLTGVFGAWGASVGRNSAGALFSEIKEWGFWDVSQSIYVEGGSLGDPGGTSAKCSSSTAMSRTGTPGGQAAPAGGAPSAVAAAAGALAPEASIHSANAAPGTAQQQQQQQGQAASSSSPLRLALVSSHQLPEQQQQQPAGFLHRLFNSKPPPPAVAAMPDNTNAGAIASDASSQHTSPQKAPISSVDGAGIAKSSSSPSKDIVEGGSGDSSCTSPIHTRAQDSPALGDGAEDELRLSFSQLASRGLDEPDADGDAAPAAAIAAAEGGGGNGQPGSSSSNSSSSNAVSVPGCSRQADRSFGEGSGGDQASRGCSGGSSSRGDERQKLAPDSSDNRDSSSSGQQPADENGRTSMSQAAGTTGGAAAGAAAGGGGDAGGNVLSSWFKGKGAGAASAPVYVPLLPIPVNARRKDEARIALTIGVNGCIGCMEDFVRPFQSLPGQGCDRFALVWENACLQEVNTALRNFLAQQAVQHVAQKTLQAFFYTGLVGALALPMALTTTIRILFGSKWRVALRRAQVAGKMLAFMLLQGCHGDRPVTLVGISMGARVVFHCLLELKRHKGHGLVEHAIMLGAPVSCRPDRWAAARSVVGGRMINGYSVNDWTLGVLYRAHSSSSIWLQAAGIWQVGVPGVENVNLSKLVGGHPEYLDHIEDILDVLNLHVV